MNAVKNFSFFYLCLLNYRETIGHLEGDKNLQPYKHAEGVEHYSQKWPFNVIPVPKIEYIAQDVRALPDDSKSSTNGENKKRPWSLKMPRRKMSKKPVETKEEREFREKDEKFRALQKDDSKDLLKTFATEYKVLVLDEIWRNEYGKSSLEALDSNCVQAVSHKVSSQVIIDIMSNLRSCTSFPQKIDNVYQLEREIYLYMVEPEGKKLIEWFFVELKTYLTDDGYHRQEFTIDEPVQVKNSDMIAKRLETANEYLNKQVLSYPLPVLQTYFKSCVKITIAVVKSEKGVDKVEGWLKFFNFLMYLLERDVGWMQNLSLGIVKFAANHKLTPVKKLFKPDWPGQLKRRLRSNKPAPKRSKSKKQSAN